MLAAFKSRMHDTLIVRGFEGLTNCLGNIQGFIDRNWSAPNSLGQRPSLNQFEDQETPTIGFFQIVDRCDVGVVERRENFGLPLESRHAFGIAAEFIGQDFDGDFPF